MTVSAVIGLPIIGLLTIVTANMKKFINGDVNPAFVLDDSSIAVFVNLAAKTREPRNAVKVIRAPLGKMAGGPYRKGDRVTTVCTYVGPPDGAGAWQGVSPIPVAAGTSDPVSLARVAASVSEQDWARAKQYVDQIKSSEPKLQRLW